MCGMASASNCAVLSSSTKSLPIVVVPVMKTRQAAFLFPPSQKIFFQIAGIFSARFRYDFLRAVRKIAAIMTWTTNAQEQIMLDRRNFLKLSAVGGGAVFMSGLFGAVSADAATGQ